MFECQGFLGCEISFPGIDSRLKQVFLFFRPPKVVNFRPKSLLETAFAQSKQICSFDDGDTHTRSIDLVGVESARSAIEVKDSQMKPETPNARNANGNPSSPECARINLISSSIMRARRLQEAFTRSILWFWNQENASSGQR